MTESDRREDVVQDTLSEAWSLFTSDFVLWIIAGLIMLIVTVVSFGILAGPMTVGFIQLVERRRRDEPASATDIFDGFEQFGASLIAFILICIGVTIGMVLLVLPGLFFGFATAFAFHAIAIDDDDAAGALAKSFELIRKDFALSAVFLVIVLVLNGIGGAVSFGILLTMPLTLILMTFAYHRLSALPANG